MYRARHALGRRPLGRISLLLALAMVVAAFAVGPLAGAGETEGPQKVAICHFDGHEAGTTFGSGDFTGDYVVLYGANGPSPRYCEETLGDYAGEMIIVSVKSLAGHRVEGLDRVAGYPDGWKG